MRRRVIGPAAQLAGDADRIMGVGVVRPQRQGAPVMADRRVEPALVFERIGEIDMGIGRTRIEL